MILASPARPVLSMVTFSRCRYLSSLVKQHEAAVKDGGIVPLDLSLPALTANPRSAPRRLVSQRQHHPGCRQDLSFYNLNGKGSGVMLTMGGIGNLKTKPLVGRDVSRSMVVNENKVDLSVGEGVQRSAASASASPGDGTSGQSNKVPPEKLQYVFTELEKHLPRFFVRVHPFALYDKDVVFEDHIRGIVVNGLNQYATSLIGVKIKANILFAKVQFHVLKMTMHPEDGTIRVRWQIEGVQGWRYALTFWRYGLFRYFFSSKEPYVSTKTDGFSIFYLNSKGLIYKHMCDKMMPDDRTQTNPVKDEKAALPV